MEGGQYISIHAHISRRRGRETQARVWEHSESTHRRSTATVPPSRAHHQREARLRSRFRTSCALRSWFEVRNKIDVGLRFGWDRVKDAGSVNTNKIRHRETSGNATGRTYKPMIELYIARSLSGTRSETMMADTDWMPPPPAPWMAAHRPTCKVHTRVSSMLMSYVYRVWAQMIVRAGVNVTGICVWVVRGPCPVWRRRVLMGAREGGKGRSLSDVRGQRHGNVVIVSSFPSARVGRRRVLRAAMSQDMFCAEPQRALPSAKRPRHVSMAGRRPNIFPAGRV